MAAPVQRTVPSRRRAPPAAFPTPMDVESAVRVLRAVGCARLVRCQDELARARQKGNAALIARLRSLRTLDENHFSWVDAALRTFR